MPPSRRQTFENTLSGAQPPPLLPPLKGDPRPNLPLPPTLENFRNSEGKQAREVRLRALWRALPANTTCNNTTKHTTSKHDASPEAERAQKMREIYEHELLSRMGRPKGDTKPVDWAEFLKYANEKEAELWRIFHHELDLVSPLLLFIRPHPHVFPDDDCFPDRRMETATWMQTSCGPHSPKLVCSVPSCTEEDGHWGVLDS